jgi:carbohydrate diacid regulator
MLTQEVAEAIVEETMLRLNRNINIIDKSGIVIASGDSSRINCFHEGGLHAIQTGKTLLITKENEDQWKGSKLGINLPIESK